MVTTKRKQECYDEFERVLGNRGIDSSFCSIGGLSTGMANGVLLDGNLKPRQVNQLLETHSWSVEYGIVNNENIMVGGYLVKTSNNDTDKIVKRYWEHYRGSMKAGNGLQIMVEDIIIDEKEDILQVCENMWITPFGDVGDTEDAILQNDSFMDSVKYLLVATIQEAYKNYLDCINYEPSI